MKDLAIISIVYHEPSYQKEVASVIETMVHERNLLHVIVERDPHGVGSLADAVNRGIKAAAIDGYRYAWILTNAKFNPDIIQPLYEAIDWNNLSAVHPAMATSDHLFKRPKPQPAITECPYVEFTAPMVRLSSIIDNPLDEDMPYWGHDLDWGYRIRKAGGTIAIDHSVQVEHDYIRNNYRNHPITTARMQARQKTNQKTVEKLIQKYGTEWKKVLDYEG